MTISVLPAPPELHTERLMLRPPIDRDFAAWADLLGDEEVTRYIGGPQPPSVAWRTMAMHAGSWALRGYGLFSVIDRGTGNCIGRVGPWFPQGWPQPEIGWSFIRSAWGHGFAIEAARTALAWTFANLGWDHIVHYIEPGNQASIAVAERIGSKLQGEARLPRPISPEKPFLVYGQSRAMHDPTLLRYGGMEWSPARSVCSKKI